MDEVTLELPPKLKELFLIPRGDIRYRGAYGGRGSAKSFSFAKMAAVFGLIEPLRILCTRELQISIKESFHAEIKRAIASETWLADHYDVGETYVRGTNGTEFIFRGLRHNITGIKSMAKVDLCIVEEAEDVPESSWRDLVPTVRAPKSEIWVIWNPRAEGSPVDTRCRKLADDSMVTVEMNWRDNPWFPKVLDDERKRDLKNCDPGVYAHVWEGAYLEISDSQILRGKYDVEEFTPRDDWEGPYFGADWGFAQDPTVLVKLWIHAGSLYVEHEQYGTGVDIDEIPRWFVQIPGTADHVVRADSARPETISYVRSHGIPGMCAAEKWAGSVEDGIAFLRSFERIVIHPRCRHTIEEARLYSYKRDRLTGDVLPIIIDAHNHCIDAIRYALEPAIQNRRVPIEFKSAGTRLSSEFGVSAYRGSSNLRGW